MDTGLIFSHLVIWFFAYAVIGWLVESLYGLVARRRLYNPGFLNGPYVPIYAVASLVLVPIVGLSVVSPVWVFVVGVIFATALEYFTHWVLEKMFQKKLWDYSDWPFNIKGRVCLQMSLAFGVLSLVALYLIQPLLVSFTNWLPGQVAVWLSVVILVVMFLDLAVSLGSVIRLRVDVRNLRGSVDVAMAGLDERLNALKTKSRSWLVRLRLLANRAYRLNLRRLTKTFPLLSGSKRNNRP